MPAWRAVLALLLVWGVAGCLKLEDCKLYNTCAGDLIDIAIKNLAPDAPEECRGCLEDSCEEEADTCSVDVECNYTARCRLTSTPKEYQACLVKLGDYGYSTGDEKRKPWEGPRENAFASCAYDSCRDHCSQARFACNATRGTYNGLKIWLAVRKYGAAAPTQETYRIASDAEARVCGRKCGDGDDDDNDDDWKQANESGVIEFPELGDDGLAAEDLYFEIRTKPGLVEDFPRTLYYPRRLGDGDTQLVSAYVVRTRDIEEGNAVLGFEASVLKEKAQSLILPDGCTWEDNSLPDMRISVTPVGSLPVPKPPDVDQCADLELCLGACRRPCVWYAMRTAPSMLPRHTDGTGAGAVGIAEGTYDIRAEDAQGHLSLRRAVQMRNGWMTVVRTWPAGG